MNSKTYIHKGLKSWNLIWQPMGKRDAVGNRIPGITYYFLPNAAGMAQLKTADAVVQANIEKTEEFKLGKVIIFTGREELPEVSPVPTQKTGALEAADLDPREPVAPARGPGRPKGVRTH